MKLFKKTAAILTSLMLAGAMLLPGGVQAAGEVSTLKGTLTVGEGQSTPEFKAGDADQTLTLTVKNKGEVEVKNIKVSPIIDDAGAWPFEISLMNNDAVMDQMDIPVGKSANAVWKGLKVRSDVENKSYKLQFRITYDVDTERYTTTKYIFAKIKSEAKPVPDNPILKPQEEEKPQNPEPVTSFSNSDPVPVSGGGGASSEKGSTPRVIVTGFSTDPGAVNAGSDFQLIVHLKNTSTKTAVSNMIFDLQAPSSGTEGATEAPAFLPSSGSSTVYLDSIPAGGVKDISIALNARADLVEKPYSITMSMKYEDKSAAQFEGTSSLAIPVKQAARFEFSDVEVTPDTVSVGDEANVTCSLYNTGRIKLYNVKVKFEGPGITSKEIFIGNVDSGATGAIDGILSAQEVSTGEEKYKMIVNYEDTAGKASTVEKEFALTIAEEQLPVGGMGMEEPESLKGGSSKTPIIIGAIAVVVGIIAAALFIGKKKKKKESLEEEDLLDEVDRFTEDE